MRWRGFDFPFRFAPIIHRNTPLPASRSEVFRTVYDQQTVVEIDVYQGENEDVRAIIRSDGSASRGSRRCRLAISSSSSSISTWTAC